MINFTFDIDDADLGELAAETEADIARALALIMEQVGWETVGLLRSLTNETRPPARAGEPHRRAHPGGWADVTSNLANAYRFELWAGGIRVRWSEPGEQLAIYGVLPGHLRFPLELHIVNGMEYAAVLEARDGYWVVREVAGAGGPVQRALRRAILKVDPEGSIQVL